MPVGEGEEENGGWGSGEGMNQNWQQNLDNSAQ